MTIPARKFALGDMLTYTRTSDGTSPIGEVRAIYEVTPNWPGGHKHWPKPVHCRYVYRIRFHANGAGDRTVCECRLREAPVFPSL